MITILDNDFNALNSYLSSQNLSRLLILVDENTHEFCMPILLSNLESSIPYEIIEIESGEEMKNISTANQLWEILAEFEADRNAVLINLGGGVITDLGGFVASTYKRGIKFIHIPTSLLAMCDASIGGKTGIDLQHLKNVVGTFALPDKIFLYPDYLKTLPEKQILSGFAEMLKHGLIADQQHWNDLKNVENLDYNHVLPFIHRSMEIKNTIVEQDYKESNIRKILNFGHTVGHAIESSILSKGESITHGEAVALGMMAETYLSHRLNLISKVDFIEIIQTLKKFYDDSFIDFDIDNVFTMMKNDKKNSHQKINFSLINGIGSCLYDQMVSDDIIIESLNYLKSAKN